MKIDRSTGWRLELPLLGLGPRPRDALDRVYAVRLTFAPLPGHWRGRIYAHRFWGPGVEPRDGALGRAPGVRE